MESKAKIYFIHSSHLDLFWMGYQQFCLDWGANIIIDAMNMAEKDPEFHFVIECVRFTEYLLKKFPEKKEQLLKLVGTGQFEICGDYTDRMENQHDGESLARNIVYGKKVLRDILGLETRIAFHPDIPGFSEQVPQIFKKGGVDYALTSRGFLKGARFNWAALDGSTTIMYDFPAHYSYYSMENDIFAHIDEIRKNICSRDIILSGGAGDLGAVNTFVLKMSDGKGKRVNLMDLIAELSQKYPEYEFRMCNIDKTLRGMDTKDLLTLSGESPPRWGLSSGRNVKLFQLDRLTVAALLQAERFSTVSALLGMPVEVSYPKNVLAHNGSSRGRRKYPELDLNPQKLAEYIEFAWRLVFVAQDHNYGGMDGDQSHFDNMKYKSSALRIATDIRAAALANIAGRVKMKDAGVVVFNPMNWTGLGRAAIAGQNLDPAAAYRAVDEKGAATPVVYGTGGWSLLARDVPAFGYKAYRLEKGSAGPAPDRTLVEDERYISISNQWYSLKIDKQRGVITALHDLETGRDIIRSESFLEFTAYRDTDNSAAEKAVDKPLLDRSTGHVRSVRVVEDNAIATTVEIITEILDAKVKIDLSLEHFRKELRMLPKIYWMGRVEVQIRMDMGFASAVEKTWYGVAYGAQLKGNALEKNLEIKSGDEIHPDLYRRYREVQQFFALEGSGYGVSVGSTHSAYDLDGQKVSAVMARCVKNCGDYDVWHRNEGILEYIFRISSYKGSWEDAHAYRPGLETINPLMAVEIEGGKGDPAKRDLPAEGSFVTAPGVLTTLKQANDGKGTVLRLYNTTSKAVDCAIGGILGLKPQCELDLEEHKLSELSGRLGAYEVKTISLTL